MDSLTVAQIVLGLAAGLVALALAVVFLRPLWLPLWHLFRRTQEFLEDWFGEPARPGQEARPGAMQRLAQLEHNGGSSLRDAVMRIEQTTASTADETRKAATLADEAVHLAGDAARAAANADQRQQDVQRAVNALRAEVNALTNVAFQDVRDIHTLLAEAGLDRRSGGDTDAPPPA